jgi:hypothetical protein
MPTQREAGGETATDEHLARAGGLMVTQCEDEVATEELLSRAGGGSTAWKLVAGAAHRLSQFVCARSGLLLRANGRMGREEGRRSMENGLEALLRSDVFANGLATLLSPLDLSRLALTCRTGAQVTSDASVWWSGNKFSKS